MSHLTSSARQRLRDLAIETLAQNDLGDSTKPAPNLYPHQWLWDSCFIAIGLRHLDPGRAAKELLSLLRGQWRTGMLPHEIFNTGAAYYAAPDKWGSAGIRAAPRDVRTTIMTQPPMVAEAAVLVGQKLSLASRAEFYQQIFPGLVRYHQWLYTERDPFRTGLAMLIHPWEAGSEDLPYWSALIVGGTALLIGIILFLIGMNQMKPKNLLPRKTINQLQRDVSVAKDQARIDDGDIQRAA